MPRDRAEDRWSRLPHVRAAVGCSGRLMNNQASDRTRQYIEQQQAVPA